jgi:hypothetical protein
MELSGSVSIGTGKLQEESKRVCPGAGPGAVIGRVLLDDVFRVKKKYFNGTEGPGSSYFRVRNLEETVTKHGL